MGKGEWVSRSSGWRAVAVGLALAVSGACGGGGGGNSKSNGQASSPAPEDQRASAVEVTAGLGKIGGVIARGWPAARAHAQAAQQPPQGIEAQGGKIGGTIRAHDKDP